MIWIVQLSANHARAEAEKLGEMTPTDRWKDRFHREGLIGPFSAYVSRPTFDMLRRSDTKGKSCRRNLLKALTNFQVDEEASKTTKPWLSNVKLDEIDINQLQVIFKEYDDHLIFAIGPFDVSTEMGKGKKGILFHQHRIPENGYSEDGISKSKLEDVIDCKEYLSHETSFQMQYDSLKPCHDKIKEILTDIGMKDVTILETDPDPNAARLLPTEPMLEFKQELDSRFRNLMCLQFLEVRLVNDPTHINIEQSLALDAYEYAFSSCMNHNGSPGTGKTTIAQIDLCESLLQPGGKERGKRKALYIATTSDLIDEARNEISGLLDYVFELHKYPVQKRKLMSSIRFCSEDGFLERIPVHEKLTLVTLEESLSKVNENLKVNENIPPTLEKDWEYWLQQTEHKGNSTFSNLDELYRILRMFVFGLFGSVSKFCAWIPEGREDSKIKEIFNTEINTFEPLFPSTANHNLKPKFIWNPFTKSMTEEKSCQLIRSLADLLEHPDGLGRYLYDRGDLTNDGYWDSSAVIYGISNDITESKGDVSGLLPKGLWLQSQEKRFDSIFIDESQDFSVLFLVIVLRHFAIRQVRTSTNNMPFSFICAGDAYQTIRGSLFQTGMEHINAIFEDWKNWLDNRRIANQPSASEGLPTTVRRVLSANYRNPEVVVDVLNHIIDQMSGVAIDMELKVRTRRNQEADAKRKGIVSRVPTDNNDKEINIWLPPLQQVIDQLKLPENSRIECKVALILPVEKFSDSREIINKLKEYRNLITNGEVLDYYQQILSSITEITLLRKRRNWSEEAIVIDLAERGICSIESVKGLTKPVVITVGLGRELVVKEAEIGENRSQQQCYELLMKWSHVLVACSRPQFALLVIDNEDDFKTITGLDDSNISLTTDFAQLLKFTSISTTDIDSTLRNSIKDPNHSELWERLLYLCRTDYDKNALTPISMWLAKSHIDVSKAVNPIAIDKDDIPPGAIEELKQIGHEGFLEQYNIATANTFIGIQKIIRAAGEDERLCTVAINELKIAMQEMEKSKPPDDERKYGQQKELSQWLDYIVGESTSISYLDRISPENPLNINPFARSRASPNLSHSDYAAPVLPPPDQFGIRLDIKKWYFPAPRAESNRPQHWMATRGIWPLPPKELRNIITKISNLGNEAYDWHLLLLEGKPKELLNAAIKYAGNGENRPLFWLLDAIIIDSSEMNSKLRLSKFLQSEIFSRLNKDKKFVGFVKSWLISTSQDVPTRLDSFSTIVDEYSSEGPIKQSITRQLNLPSILTKWFKVKYSNEEIITNGKVIQNGIKRLGDEDLAKNISSSLDMRKYLTERQSNEPLTIPETEKINLTTTKFLNSLTSPAWGEFTKLNSTTIHRMLRHKGWANATYDQIDSRPKLKTDPYFNSSIIEMIDWVHNSGESKIALVTSFKPIMDRLLEKLLQQIIGKSIGSKFETQEKYDLVYHIFNKENWEQMDIPKIRWRDGHRFWFVKELGHIRKERMPELSLTGDPRYDMTPQQLGKHRSDHPYRVKYPKGCANHFMLNCNTFDGYLKWMKKSKSKGSNTMEGIATQFIRGGAIQEAATILMLMAAEEANKVKTPKLKVEIIVRALALVIMLPAFVYGIHIGKTGINWKAAQRNLFNNRGAKSHKFIQEFCNKRFYLKPMGGASWGNPKSGVSRNMEKFRDADSENPEKPFIAYWNNVANYQKALICGRRLLLSLEENPTMNPKQYLSMVGEKTFSRMMFSNISEAKTRPARSDYEFHGFGKLTKQEFSSCDELNWLLSLEEIDQLIDPDKSEKFIMNFIAPKSMRNCRGTLGQKMKPAQKSKRDKSTFNEEQDAKEIEILKYVRSENISLEDIKEKFSE